jgi:DNA-binding MarR family transcriptional regulator
MTPEELNHLFIRAHHLHFKRAHGRFSAFGLGEGQPRLLKLLSQEEGLSQAELARRCSLEPATVTVTLNRMEKTGLAERRADTEDLRISRVWLTAAGREMNAALDRVFAESAGECFDGFTGEEMEQFASFLRRVMRNLGGACGEQGRPGECD